LRARPVAHGLRAKGDACSPVDIRPLSPSSYTRRHHTHALPSPHPKRGSPPPTADRGNGSFHFKVYFAPPEFHNAAGTADRGFSAKNGGMDARDVLLPSSAGSTKEAALPDSRSSRQHAEE